MALHPEWEADYAIWRTDVAHLTDPDERTAIPRAYNGSSNTQGYCRYGAAPCQECAPQAGPRCHRPVGVPL